MKLKIGIDARVLLDEHYSGVAEYAANLLEAILQIDTNSQYYLFYNTFNNSYLKLKKFERLNCSRRGSRYPNKIFNYLLQKFLKQPKIDKFLGGVDIYFSPHFNFINLKKGTKFVITIHDISFLRHPQFFSYRKNFWHQALRLKKLLERADVIVAVSANTKADLIEVLKIPAEKIVVIYSGNNYDILPVVDTKALQNYRQKLGLPLRFILFVGNIEPRKNLSNLILAYNLLRQAEPELADVALVIAGAPGWKHKAIYQTWKNSPYKDDIKFLGYVDTQEKEYLYRLATVFAYPSFYEGFGFPPLEAMRFSLPVVASNVSSLPEILGRSALLVDPFRPDEIKQALHLVLKDDNLRAELIKRGEKQAALFSWEKTARAYIKLWQDLK
ncbi:MAG: hypothetical protein PWQ35_69 [Patescibacteria group bacterium]|nr:hypothetical protein [Patescibacteria group bacterium]